MLSAQLVWLLSVALVSASELVTVAGGSFGQEISWTLTCSDGTSLSGGAPFSSYISVGSLVTCTLDMVDSYDDGWNGYYWSGFGQSYTLPTGSSGQETFVTPAEGVTIESFEGTNLGAGWMTGTTGTSWTRIAGSTPTGELAHEVDFFDLTPCL